MNIAEFRSSRQTMTPAEYEASALAEGLSMRCYSSVRHLLVYADCAYIERLTNGVYQVWIGDSLSVGTDLAILEEKLFAQAIDTGLVDS